MDYMLMYNRSDPVDNDRQLVSNWYSAPNAGFMAPPRNIAEASARLEDYTRKVVAKQKADREARRRQVAELKQNRNKKPKTKKSKTKKSG